MEENKVIQIPEWILESVKDALQMNYNAMVAGGDTSCTRRQTAKAINYVNLYLTKDVVTDDDIIKCAMAYTTGTVF